MEKLTRQQEIVRAFIEQELNAGRPCPSYREIAIHFGFASHNAAACHIKALIKKGVLIAEQGKVRALRLAKAFSATSQPMAIKIPLFGSIQAGIPQTQEQEADGCISVDVDTLGFKPTRNTFALRVVGDSMTGKHICDGDIVIVEFGAEPLNGQVVAAFVDGRSTLKTFVVKNGKPFLRAENPRYKNIIPAEELTIQGVLKGLIRSTFD